MSLTKDEVTECLFMQMKWDGCGRNKIIKNINDAALFSSTTDILSQPGNEVKTGHRDIEVQTDTLFGNNRYWVH